MMFNISRDRSMVSEGARMWPNMRASLGPPILKFAPQIGTTRQHSCPPANALHMCGGNMIPSPSRSPRVENLSNGTFNAQNSLGDSRSTPQLIRPPLNFFRVPNPRVVETPTPNTTPTHSAATAPAPRPSMSVHTPAGPSSAYHPPPHARVSAQRPLSGRPDLMLSAPATHSGRGPAIAPAVHTTPTVHTAPAVSAAPTVSVAPTASVTPDTHPAPQNWTVPVGSAPMDPQVHRVVAAAVAQSQQEFVGMDETRGALTNFQREMEKASQITKKTDEPSTTEKASLVKRRDSVPPPSRLRHPEARVGSKTPDGTSSAAARASARATLGPDSRASTASGADAHPGPMAKRAPVASTARRRRKSPGGSVNPAPSAPVREEILERRCRELRAQAESLRQQFESNQRHIAMEKEKFLKEKEQWNKDKSQYVREIASLKRESVRLFFSQPPHYLLYFISISTSTIDIFSPTLSIYSSTET
eukprot:GEMP01029742.1.p1 GENE.GEMP01029742.1~~GEMP01029742.1.p1  ORF type:complete len:474 (+),score=101.69 GEMP01029742.1:122-1543(+)